MASLTRQFAILRLFTSSEYPICPSALQSCSFSTTSRLQQHKAKRTVFKEKQTAEYPYGKPQWYKQSDTGLYGGRKVRFGNMVSEKNEIKNRRKWHPNVRHKSLYSEALGQEVKLKLVTRVIRSIDKAGGLDRYLTGDKPRRIKDLGREGWKLRAKVMDTKFWRRKMAKERGELGLIGIAPWEIKSVPEALLSGYHYESMGLTKVEADNIIKETQLLARSEAEATDIKESDAEKPTEDLRGVEEEDIEEAERLNFMAEEELKRWK